MIRATAIERAQRLIILLMGVMLLAAILYREWPQEVTSKEVRPEALPPQVEKLAELEPVIEQPPAESGDFQDSVHIILPPPPVSPADQDIAFEAPEPPQPEPPKQEMVQQKAPPQQEMAQQAAKPALKPVSITPLKPLASPEPASPEQVPAQPTSQPVHEIQPLSPPEPIQQLRPVQQEEITLPAEETLADVQPVETSPAPQPAPPQEIYEEAEPPQKIEANEIPAKEIQAKGRPLLRLMEYGQGSAVNIAWPADVTAMTRLYDELNRCYGMESLVIHQGRLYNRVGLFEPNQDRYSSFMREVQGQIPPRESEFLRKIPVSGAPVRLFPRRVDAMLLGGLHHLLGQEAMDGHHISGTYSLAQNRLLVTDLRLDGVQVEGAVDLTAIRRCL